MFDKFEGFEISTLYPGYSTDFFDTHHNVVVRGLRFWSLLPLAHAAGTKIGGSYATMPRIAERRTVRNWYQRNYPYAWIGGRVAYDVEE
jgi:formylglycine-generating enzyme required for sulfatase activity